MSDDNEQDESKLTPLRLEFGNLDNVMLLMINGATNLIERTWSVEKQAKRIAEFNAFFMAMRITHEEQHTTMHNVACPFCASLKLNTHLHREQEDIA